MCPAAGFVVTGYAAKENEDGPWRPCSRPSSPPAWSLVPVWRGSQEMRGTPGQPLFSFKNKYVKRPPPFLKTFRKPNRERPAGCPSHLHPPKHAHCPRLLPWNRKLSLFPTENGEGRDHAGMRKHSPKQSPHRSWTATPPSHVIATCSWTWQRRVSPSLPAVLKWCRMKRHQPEGDRKESCAAGPGRWAWLPQGEP